MIDTYFWRQEINGATDDLLFITPLGTKFSHKLTKNTEIFFMSMHFKLPSVKICSDLNMLTATVSHTKRIYIAPAKV